MVGGGDIIRKLFRGFKKTRSLQAFGLEDFKDKNTLRGWFEVSKTRNNLQRKYKSCTKQQATYDSKVK